MREKLEKDVIRKLYNYTKRPFNVIVKMGSEFCITISPYTIYYNIVLDLVVYINI